MALELGPVVRAVSWLAETRGMTIIDAVAELARLDASARLRIDQSGCRRPGRFEIELGAYRCANNSLRAPGGGHRGHVA